MHVFIYLNVFGRRKFGEVMQPIERSINSTFTRWLPHRELKGNHPLFNEFELEIRFMVSCVEFNRILITRACHDLVAHFAAFSLTFFCLGLFFSDFFFEVAFPVRDCG